MCLTFKIFLNRWIGSRALLNYGFKGTLLYLTLYIDMLWKSQCSEQILKPWIISKNCFSSVQVHAYFPSTPTEDLDVSQWRVDTDLVAIEHRHGLWSLFSKSLWFYDIDKTYPAEEHKVLRMSFSIYSPEICSTVQHKIRGIEVTTTLNVQKWNQQESLLLNLCLETCINTESIADFSVKGHLYREWQMPATSSWASASLSL